MSKNGLNESPIAQAQQILMILFGIVCGNQAINIFKSLCTFFHYKNSGPNELVMVTIS